MSRLDLVLGISTVGPVEIVLLGAGPEIALSSDAGALESLVALVKEVLARADRRIEDVTLIGVCTGPGSFTGLRIGVAFAKTLAQTRGIPIVGISSYDVAAYSVRTLPLISVARGKRDHYYGRVTTAPEKEPVFIQGTREVVKRAAAEAGSRGNAATIVGPDFSVAQPGDAARAVAQLAREAQNSASLDWTNIGIDYGQRPNAVVNWEKRHGTVEEGPPV